MAEQRSPTGRPRRSNPDITFVSPLEAPISEEQNSSEYKLNSTPTILRTPTQTLANFALSPLGNSSTQVTNDDLSILARRIGAEILAGEHRVPCPRSLSSMEERLSSGSRESISPACHSVKAVSELVAGQSIIDSISRVPLCIPNTGSLANYTVQSAFGGRQQHDNCGAFRTSKLSLAGSAPHVNLDLQRSSKARNSQPARQQIFEDTTRISKDRARPTTPLPLVEEQSSIFGPQRHATYQPKAIIVLPGIQSADDLDFEPVCKNQIPASVLTLPFRVLNKEAILDR